jgi:N-methylhydantoinase A/acetone carboxylase, beta subunit
VKNKIIDDVGRDLGFKNIEETASAIIRIANMNMAGALRLVSLSRGYDPRDFALFAFGGAGPLHAVALAAELGIPKVLIPMRPGITNAVGCVVADVRHDYVNSINVPLSQADMDQVHDIFASQIKAGNEIIASEGIDIEEIVIIHNVDMQFQGQTHILNFPLNNPIVSRSNLQSLFENAYLKRFNVELPEIRAVLVNLHTSVIGRRKPIPLKTLISQEKHKKKLSECIKHSRPVWFDSGWHDTPIYNREFLTPKIKIQGPCGN